MSYAISTTDQFPFQRFLFYSVFLHLSVSVVMLAGVWLQRSGNQWGSIGGGGDSGFKVNIVAPAAPAGIPMLQPTNATDSGVVDPTMYSTLRSPIQRFVPTFSNASLARTA